VEPNKVVTVAQLDAFDEVIDVRSPAEFADDHVPGAISCPVLDDEERARVGTLYKQDSPFAARRVGAALVARNIAHHLETVFHDRPRQWRPLVYCWRGGGRSDAMCEIMRRVGWHAAKLDGGYRAYRREVIEALEALPGQIDFVAICGRTGSGKSGALRALGELGEQVLDLERLACHRGSVLGELPGVAQPSQKYFESLLRSTLRAFDPQRPVFVESESRKVGNVQVPAALIARIRASRCVVIEAGIEVRTALLLDEYRHFLLDNAALSARLNALAVHYGNACVERWTTEAGAGRHEVMVQDLLRTHYDPSYDRSIQRNFPGIGSAPVVRLMGHDADSLREAARLVAAAAAPAEALARTE
jgi:tRNA 2-selenouridine synthase